jgi:hypothetical protein
MNFEIFMMVTVEIVFFWVARPYSLVYGYQHFGGTSSGLK